MFVIAGKQTGMEK